MKTSFVVLAICCFNISCGDQNRVAENSRNSLVKQGFQKFPIAKLISEKFDSVSFIANYGNQFAVQEWHTRFYIHGWFECVYAQKVQIKNGELSSVDQPKLYIFEISSVNVRGTSYDGQKIFEGKEIQEFVDAGFDLKLAGFSVDENRDPPKRDMMKQWHEIYPNQ